MQQFLEALLQFPTAVFAGLLAISLFYWGLVIVGAAHLNPFHGAHGLEGAVKGGVEGAVKGGVHAVAGAVKGAASAVHAGTAKANALSEALAFLGLTKVPITVSFSIFSLFSWFISIASHQALDPVLGDGVASAAAATAAALIGGFVVTSLVTKPLSGLFAESTRTDAKVTLTGRVVKVTTEIADDMRGQGEIDDGAGGIAVQIRTAPGVSMKRGEEAVAILHNEQDGSWLVEPQRTLVPSEEERLAAPVELAVEESRRR